jgi:CRISPR/Cas system CSM-associated protein Csm3 (group 7 of RAMP superfamily)
MRLTIEANSPLSPRSGDWVRLKRRRPQVENGKTGEKIAEETLEVALVRDANGLPTIPGTTLQGLLRHLYEDVHGNDDVHLLFGYAVGEGGQAGRLIVGFGCVHDSNNKAVVQLISPDDLEQIVEDGKLNTKLKDPILAALHGSDPLRRDHVALNPRHVADGRKKFERIAVPVGTRFSFEFALWGTQETASVDEMCLRRVVSLFGHPAFRIGGAGRHGYGKVRLVQASYLRPRLDTSNAFLNLRTLRAQPASAPFAGESGIGDWSNLATSMGKGVVTATVTLQPINPWRVGGGTPVSLTEQTHGVRLPDGTAPLEQNVDRRGEENDIRDVATIVREPTIKWSGSTAILVVDKQPRKPDAISAPGLDRAVPFDGSEDAVGFVVHGSAIKGPLTHRTLYHWNRGLPNGKGVLDVDEKLEGNERREKLAQLQSHLKLLESRPSELSRLFGAAKERDDKISRESGTELKGRAARLLVDDAPVINVTAVRSIDHVSIDRFTGGARPGFLFLEEVLVGGKINVTLTLLPSLSSDKPSLGDIVAGWSAPLVTSFLRALRDLCEGRLAIGAKSLGFCEKVGDIAWRGDDDIANAWRAAWLGISAEGASEAVE